MTNVPSTNEQLNVACIQMVSSTDVSQNLQVAEQLITQAKDKESDLVVLPEFFAIMGETENAKLALVEKHGKGKVQDFIKQQAKKHQLWVVGGTHAIDSGIKEKPYSRAYVYSPEGKVETWYDKIHLFDVTVDDNTRSYCESRHASPGDLVKSFQIGKFKIGIAVCYDLRFPELFRLLTQQGCNAFVVPAAFTAKTGKAHWDVLLKARAIENQAFLLASAQGGVHANGRETWGNSCIISPWGDIMAAHQTGTGIVQQLIEFKQVEKIRNEFPVLTHTRL